MEEKQNSTTNEIFRAVGKLEGELEGILNQLNQINSKMTSYSQRLNTLEEHQAEIRGKSAIIGGIAGAILSAFLWFLNTKFFK